MILIFWSSTDFLFCALAPCTFSCIVEGQAKKVLHNEQNNLFKLPFSLSSPLHFILFFPGWFVVYECLQSDMLCICLPVASVIIFRCRRYQVAPYKITLGFSFIWFYLKCQIYWYFSLFCRVHPYFCMEQISCLIANTRLLYFHRWNREGITNLQWKFCHSHSGDWRLVLMKRHKLKSFYSSHTLYRPKKVGDWVSFSFSFCLVTHAWGSIDLHAYATKEWKLLG